MPETDCTHSIRALSPTTSRTREPLGSSSCGTGVIVVQQLASFPGRENVETVVLDMCKAYKSSARQTFPNAELVGDRFHVIRLLSPHVLRRPKEIVAKRTDAATRGLLLADVKKLEYAVRMALGRFLERHPSLLRVWLYYQRIMGFYRIRGQKRADKALTRITDVLAREELPELQTFRKTLMEWRKEILAYFRKRVTNARCAGFNNKAKLVKRRAYGYRSFRTYRLRLLNACA